MATREFSAGIAGCFPVGTKVSVHTQVSPGLLDRPPTSDKIATAKVTASGLTFTGLEENVPYTAYAEVEGEHRFLHFRAKPSGDPS